MTAERFGFPQPWLSLTLFVVWQALSDGVSGGSVVLGAILAIIIPQITHRFWPDSPTLHRPWVFIRFLAIVFYDIIVASFAVAVLIINTREPRPAFVSYPLTLKHPRAITMLASTISLTPGTVSADVSDDGKLLLIHALDVDDDAELIRNIHHRYEKPLLEVFQ
ncbi:multisubunit potassium/proton antiporter, PhaE subunit [Marinobacter daqiaonensis]|uniref:Multisubunit potassium/proton antiporter, PhaE subunit n=1 Tax=Marinobacter daqiaonensis TaxID=650891 RepID=A0A1I6HL00_9GAMM|nr:Na+/H+ antiporter subunit E [Marinobacter daqiaonensis]SFR55141.1 multisubunit potassium/proton antiporter, PhaE subunit [Marinobacter daqiaonensis]